MGLYDDYPLPTRDGGINLYVSLEAKASGSFQGGKSAIFVNGMANSPEDHRQSAVELSLLLMRPVYGLFNQSNSAFVDLFQCVLDKHRFSTTDFVGNTLQTGADIVEYLKGGNAIKDDTAKMAVIRDLLSVNPASLALFDLLRRPNVRNIPIYAHSQGNLLLSNALTAIEAVYGTSANLGREVNSYGSPTVYWPAGLNHREYAFIGDPVALLSGFDFGFNVSKVGLHNWNRNAGKADKFGVKLKPSIDWGIISHGFLIYMYNDPQFVVNRFRTGSFGQTLNMDEDGLADALIEMSRNTVRVLKIFEHLAKDRNCDADDVAVLYVQKLRASVRKNGPAIRGLQLNGKFRKLLIRILDEGWTSGDEYAAIDWLKGPLFV